MKRRSFLKQTSIVSTGVFVDINIKTSQHTSMKNKSDLIILATNWGFDGDIFQFCEKASNEGYDGIEVWVPSDKASLLTLSQAVNKYQLKLGLLAGGSDKDFSTHQKQFQQSINDGITLNPIYINCHSG